MHSVFLNLIEIKEKIKSVQHVFTQFRIKECSYAVNCKLIG